jgi:hypothetical protein
MGRRSPAGVRRTKHGRPEATKLVDHVFIEAMALAAPLDLRIAWILAPGTCRPMTSPEN